MHTDTLALRYLLITLCYVHCFYCLAQLERLLLGFELDYLATGAAIDTMEKVMG